MSLNEIKNLPGVELFENISLEKYTTIRLSCRGNIALVHSVESLTKIVSILLDSHMTFHMIGWGANQILHNTENVLFIKLNFIFDRNYLSSLKSEYRIPASVSLSVLSNHAMKFGLRGWEVFTGIPGSLGGAIYMNAGTSLGEIGDLVKNVKVLKKSGEIVQIEIKNKPLCFSYRKNLFLKKEDIILEATLIHSGVDLSVTKEIKNYLEKRKRTQPLKTKNCGSVFKNFSQNHIAGQFIDILGLKELGVNSLAVSDKHANFIENTGGASSSDFIELTNLLKYELELFSGIEFELEAKVY